MWGIWILARMPGIGFWARGDAGVIRMVRGGGMGGKGLVRMVRSGVGTGASDGVEGLVRERLSAWCGGGVGDEDIGWCMLAWRVLSA
jgi:hypothetical protein